METFDTAVENLKTITDTEKELAEYKTSKIQEIEVVAADFKGDSSKGEIKRLSDIIVNTSSTPADIADAQSKLNMLDSNVISISSIYTAAINSVVVNDKTTLLQQKVLSILRCLWLKNALLMM